MGTTKFFSSDYSGMVRGKLPSSPDVAPYHLTLMGRDGELIFQIRKKDNVEPLGLRFTHEQAIRFVKATLADRHDLNRDGSSATSPDGTPYQITLIERDGEFAFQVCKKDTDQPLELVFTNAQTSSLTKATQAARTTLGLDERTDETG